MNELVEGELYLDFNPSCPTVSIYQKNPEKKSVSIEYPKAENNQDHIIYRFECTIENKLYHFGLVKVNTGLITT